VQIVEGGALQFCHFDDWCEEMGGRRNMPEWQGPG
jgi:hypothetical protein